MRIGKLLYKGAHQAPLSMEFSRQEYWSELPFPSPGDLTNPGIEPGSPALQSDSLSYEYPGKPWLPLLSNKLPPNLMAYSNHFILPTNFVDHEFWQSIVGIISICSTMSGALAEKTSLR